MTTPLYRQQTTITLGELCEALADSRVPSQVSEGFYLVSERDLARYLERRNVSNLLALLERPAADRLVRAS